MSSLRSSLSPRVPSPNSSINAKAGAPGPIFLEVQLTRNTSTAKTPLERAKLLLENTSPFKNIHAETAVTGQTAPPPDLNVDLHFTCFVEAPDASVRAPASGQYSKRLIELDGSRDGPMDHGVVDNFLKVRNRRRVSKTFTCRLTVSRAFR